MTTERIPDGSTIRVNRDINSNETDSGWILPEGTEGRIVDFIPDHRWPYQVSVGGFDNDWYLSRDEFDVIEETAQ